MSLVKNLGHVGIICDDFLKMRDFYTRVIGLTVTDEDPDRGSCFLSADPENEHHELNLGQARGPEHPDGARPATQNVGQISYIVPDMAALRELDRRFKAEGPRFYARLPMGSRLAFTSTTRKTTSARSITRRATRSSRASAGPLTWIPRPTRRFLPSRNHSRRSKGPSRAQNCPWAKEPFLLHLGVAENPPGSQNRATGFTGDPVPPTTRNGLIVSMNS